MQFELIYEDKRSKARAGVLHTPHGDIETPIFMPVGTAGTVKAIEQQTLRNTVGAQIILGNTYHLYLRPGLDVLQAAGGLHAFMQWPYPILTDSGGYQVYSLAGNRKIKEEGVVFKSHIDGSSHTFSPESVMDIQRKIGADIIMAFDECTPYPCDFSYAESSMHLTHRWLDRCVTAWKSYQPLYGFSQALFPIVQGSTYPALRKQSAEYIAAAGTFSGHAIGGLSVGEPAEEMYAMTDLVTDILPLQKPRYLMGVGTPANILECIERGIDMFDCVMPTRNARNGMIFTTEGIINLRNERWKNDFSVLDANLANGVSNQYTKAYVRHLFVSDEMLGPMLATIQNLSFYLWLAQSARRAICEDNFTRWKASILPILTSRVA
jgi:queuine tRNA-ribosyltransferase